MAHRVQKRVCVHTCGAEHLVQRLDRDGHGVFKLAENRVVLVLHHGNALRHLLGMQKSVLCVFGNLVALLRGFGQSGGQEIQRAGARPLCRSNSAVAAVVFSDSGRERLCFGAGPVAVFHGAAQGRLNDADTCFHLAATGLQGQKFRLHDRNLLKRRIEALLRGVGFLSAQITFARQRVQTGLIGALITLGLFAEIAGPDTVHQQNRRGDNGPCDHGGCASEGYQLGCGTQPDEARIGI